MKKKLKALPLKIQLAGVGLLLVLVLVMGYTSVVSPEHAKAADLQKQVDAEQTQIFKRRAEARAGLHPPTIQTADLFRLARAMPEREDMPGIILTLSQVARAAGISFTLIEPVMGNSTIPTGPYTVDRIHLLFNGDFYGLSDFLYRIRNLVAVRHGELEASGRLFNIDTVTFNVQGDKFPQISAELFVDAYVYQQPAASTPSTGAVPTTTSPTAPTTDTSSTDSSSVTASGPVP